MPPIIEKDNGYYDDSKCGENKSSYARTSHSQHYKIRAKTSFKWAECTLKYMVTQ